MPHAGLMDEGELGPVKSELVRTWLHIRSGRRRLRQGKVAEGISTLYDAFLSALRWYALSHGRDVGLETDPGGEVDERGIHSALVGSGVLEDGAFFDEFEAVMRDAVDKKLGRFDHAGTVGRFDAAMERLGVVPFDESALPPEDPKTF